VNLTGSDLTQASFMEANLEGAVLDQVKAQYAIFMQAKMTKASLKGAFLRQTSFGEADLTGVDLSGAELEASIFEKSICRAARFVGANLTYCDFSHADLSGADMSRARLFRTKLHRITEEYTRWDAGKAQALGTDPERAEAEDWQPQP